MRIVCLLLIFSLGSVVSNAQIVNIPDANFKDALVNHMVVDTDGDGNGDVDADINDDGEIQVSEAEAVIDLIIRSFGIGSLVGIESFSNLEVLNCRGNQLTLLDLTQNNALTELICYENLLSSLDVTQNPNLEVLECYQNQLINIDVTQNTNLKLFWCSENELTNLDVTQNQNLEDLWFDSNELTNIDVTQNPNLKSLLCALNNLTSLDVTQNPSLEFLWCQENQVESLDLTQNPGLKNLRCSANEIISLDVSQNINLEYLWCTTNHLTSLNINNGNNIVLDDFNALNNPNLTCIQVDNVVYANNHPSWFKDGGAQYSKECVLGISENNPTLVTLFPNPTTHLLFISSQEHISGAKIFDLQGKLVKEVFIANIDVLELDQGLYLIQIFIGDKVFTKKFIKY